MDIGSHINTNLLRRSIHAVEAVFLVLIVAVVALSLTNSGVRAAGLGPRVVIVDDSGTSVTTTHTYQFDIETVHALGSIEFEYCSNSPLSGTPCTPPIGLDVSGANLTSQIGETGFIVDAATTVNRVVIGRAAVPTTPGSNEYVFDNVVNPTNPNQTVFVRISTFATSDGTGPFTDNGGVAYATSPIFSVNAYVPPFLILCVGVTVAPDCSTVTGTNIDLGVLASTTTASASSQFGAATNDPLGYQAYTVGTTMTAGNNVIPALVAQTPSIVGTSQYGINVRANTNPSVGQNPSGIGSGVLTNLYDDQNLFRFQSGDMVASSPNSTDFNIYTISYLVNVNPSQPPGRYSTTMTVVGIAAF